MLKKVNQIVSYAIPIIVLFILVQATIPWCHFHDIVADTWSTLALYGGMTSYDYGSVHLPMLHALQHFLIKVYIDLGVYLGYNIDAILNIYRVPISEVPKILHQLVFIPTIPLNLLLLMKNAVFIINVLIAFLIAGLAQKISPEKRYITNILFLFTLFNPVIFCVFFILVKIDEALSLLGVVGVLYLLLKQENGSSKVSMLDAVLIGILSAFPVLSKLYFPAFPLLSSFIFYKICRGNLKGAVAVLLGTLLISIPFISDLIQWYKILIATGLTTVLHPGFYTLFSLVRLGGYRYTEQITTSLGELLLSIRLLLLILIGLYIVVLLISILGGRTARKEDYVIVLLNYLIFETGIRLLLTSNVLIQYLPMPIILFTLYLLLQDRVKSRLFILYYILTIISSISFILYEIHNLFLGYATFNRYFDESLFLATNTFMSGTYWDPSVQLMLMPSFMAGFTLWFIPLLISILSISSSLKRLSEYKPASAEIKETLKKNLRKIPMCLALIIIALLPVYLYSFARCNPTPYNVPTKTITIMSELNHIYTLNVPIFPSIKYTITILPEDMLHNMSIRVIRASSHEIYGSFSRSLFQFMANVDVPNQLRRFSIHNNTGSSNLTKISILYCDAASNINHVVKNALEDSQIVITIGPCKYEVGDLTVTSQGEQVLPMQINGWRSILTIPCVINAGSHEIIYNDEVFTVIKLKDGKMIGILKTAIRLPSIPFAKSISEDIPRAILKIISLLNSGNIYQEVVELTGSNTEIIIPAHISNKTDIIIVDQEPLWWFPITYVKIISSSN